MKKALLKRKDLEVFVKKVLSEAEEKHEERALVFGLIGNLGAGKTTFTQVLAGILGAREGVKSPTFILMKKYPITWKDKKMLVHIDAYRLENKAEAVPLGLPEIFANPENIVVIEWADRIEEWLPENTHKLFFEFIDEETRSVRW